MLMKNNFEFIEYNSVSYPQGYCSTIKEVAGHLDKEDIEIADNYSLHTEYSYGKRKFNSRLISNFEELKISHKDGVPQLWKTDKWAKEFAHFIIESTKYKTSPSIIEIHPPLMITVI